MKRFSFFVLYILLSYTVFAQTNLNAFQGNWQMKTSGKIISESWSKESDNLYIGISYQIEKEDSTLLETVQLKEVKGVFSYIVKGSDNSEEVAFPLKNVSDSNSKFVFENLSHDFPSRIIYHFKTGDKLEARIEGLVDGKFKAVDFHFVKLK